VTLSQQRCRGNNIDVTNQNTISEQFGHAHCFRHQENKENHRILAGRDPSVTMRKRLLKKRLEFKTAIKETARIQEDAYKRKKLPK